MNKQIKSFDELTLYLDISKNEIICKKQCEIFIDKTEYSEDSIQETVDYYIVPGVIDIHFIEDDKYVTLPFSYDIHLYKPENFIDEKKYLQLTYEPGEIIIKQKYKNLMNITTSTRILQGQTKFIKNPENLVFLQAEVVKYSVDLVYLEVLTQQLFRCKDDESKPCRLCDQTYKNCELVPLPQIPYKISWLVGLGFERLDKAIEAGLFDKADIKDTAFEKLLIEY